MGAVREFALREGECAVFGYGSLLSRASLESTLRGRYGRPLFECELAGWSRTWDIAMPNAAFYAESPSGRLVPASILYLNISRTGAQDAVNGVLFALSRDQLEAMDRREWIYDRFDVTGALRGVRVTGGLAFAYVAKPEYVLRDVERPEQAAVRASYLAIIDTGLAELGAACRAAYERSTEPVPAHLVIQDRYDPDAAAPSPAPAPRAERSAG
jgi:cation transport regulator ChaC